MNTEALKKQDFLPVLLGSDINVYGMARSFHEAYGYKSVAVGKGILPACTHSHIVEVLKVEPRLEEDDVFVRTLTEFAKNFSGQRLLLVPCGDNYIKMLVRNQTKLRGIYEFECISEELLMRLSIKESFYQVCRSLIAARSPWFMRSMVSNGRFIFERMLEWPKCKSAVNHIMACSLV